MMSRSLFKRIVQNVSLVMGFTVLIGTGFSVAASAGALTKGKVALKSVSVMTFGPDNVLFVGDPQSATIFALNTGKAEPAKQSQAFNIKNIDQQIAAALGVTLDQLTFNDLVVHPVTKEAYIAVTRGHGPKAIPVIVTVNANGRIAPLNLENIEHSLVKLTDPPKSNVTFWRKIPARSLTITDLDYVNGELLVAGMSNADFSSSLRKVPYPFGGTVSTSSVEIYHAVHNQNETRAPIRAQTIVTLDGKPHLLASYTCTPVVTIPLDQLKDGAHVKGKTIADLGYASTPIDMIRVQTKGEKGVENFVLVTSKQRGAAMMNLKHISEGNAQKGLAAPVGFKPGGVGFLPVPLGGVLHIDNQDEQYLLALRRNIETGSLDLLSFRKGAYFRLSDFVSEYNYPDYVYPKDGSQDYYKNFQNMLKMDEGFPELVRK